RSAAADQQLPYILSGGMGGVGLITFGVGVLLVAQIRTERQKLATVLEVMALGVAKATGGEPIVLDQAARADTPPDTLVVTAPSDPTPAFPGTSCAAPRARTGRRRNPGT